MPPDSNLIEFGGLWFRWDLNKAARNFREHRVRFEQAVRVFADGLAESLPDYSSSTFCRLNCYARICLQIVAAYCP